MQKIKYPLEGYLFPATYSFYEKNPTIDEIVTVMLDKTQSVLHEYRDTNGRSSPCRSINY